MTAKYVLLLLLVIFLGIISRTGFFLDPIEEDSAVFISVGQGITQGALPYKYLWDNKPPVVYYLNAAAIYLFGNSTVSVKIFELVWQFLSSVAVLFVARKLFSINTGIVLSILYTLVVSFKDLNVGGNFTETYLLGFELLALFFILKFFKFPSTRYVFISGLFMGLVFMTKQSGTALSFLTFVYLILGARGKDRIILPLLYCLAFAVPFVSFSLYFMARVTFPDFIDQVFVFNWFYLKDTFLSSANIIIFIKTFYQIGKYLIPVLFLAVLSGVFVIRNIKRVNSDYIFILILFVVELIFVFLTGGKYEHYFLQIVVSGVFLSGIAIEEFVVKARLIMPLRIAVTAAVLLLFIKPFYLQSLNIRDSLEKRYVKKQINGVEKVANYIKQKTPSDKTIFVWGYKPQIYFLSRRASATRYFYNLPMIYGKYFSQSKTDELISQLKTNKPYVIVDVNNDIRENSVIYKALNMTESYDYKGKIDDMFIYELKV